MSATRVVPVRTGHWGKRARHALDLLRGGAIVELLDGGDVLGYLVPPRLPFTDDVIERLVQSAPPEHAALLRAQYEALAASGRWRYDPVNNRIVALPALPDFPRVEIEEDP